MKKRILSMIGILLAAMFVMSAWNMSTVSAESKVPEMHMEPQQGAYVVLWPDGSYERFADEAAANAAASELKLLYKGTTDDKGQIELANWMASGEIVIRETKAPEGYKIENAETTADLSAGSVTIVNPKEEASVSPTAETPKKPEVKDASAGPKSAGAKKTGDNGMSDTLGLLLVLASLMIGYLCRYRKTVTG